MMKSVSVNKFRDSLKAFVDSVIDRHEPLIVTRRNGKDFVVISLEDWESEQETIHILQDPYLMSQIRAAQAVPGKQDGYIPSEQEMEGILAEDKSEILSV